MTKVKPSGPSGPRQVIGLWLPNWPIQRVLAEQPRLRDAAVVLYARSARQKLVVAHCSAQALQLGVEPGQPLAEAQAILPLAMPGKGNPPRGTGGERGACAAGFPHYEEHQPREDRQALRGLAEWCQRFAPQVCLADETNDALWLDVTGIPHLFGGESCLLGQLAAGLQALGWQAHLALAGSFAAAWALARYRAQPDKPLWVPAEELVAAVGELPVQALQLAERTTTLLEDLGLERVGLLNRVARSSLAMRLGAQVPQQVDALLGRAPACLPVVHTPRPWLVSWQPDGPLEDTSTVQGLCEHLLTRLCQQLRQQGLGATRVEVWLRTVDRRWHQQSLSFFSPNATEKHWLEIFRVRAETWRIDVAVELLEVEALAPAPLPTRQQELFATGTLSETQQHEIAELVDRLSVRMGASSVLLARLVPDAQPDRAYQLEPWIDSPQAQRKRSGAGGRKKTPRRQASSKQAASDEPVAGSAELAQVGRGLRPARLFARNSPETVVTGLTTQMNARGEETPASFVWQGQTYHVTRCWGPERIQTGWWRGRRLACDYFRVECRAGNQAWLSRAIPSGSWHLEGWFD